MISRNNFVNQYMPERRRGSMLQLFADKATSRGQFLEYLVTEEWATYKTPTQPSWLRRPSYEPDGKIWFSEYIANRDTRPVDRQVQRVQISAQVRR